MIQMKVPRSRRFSLEIKRKTAFLNDAVTITLEREIDISRGDVLLNKEVVNSNSSFLSSLIWFDSKDCYQNRAYLFKMANKAINCELVKIKNKININSLNVLVQDLEDE